MVSSSDLKYKLMRHVTFKPLLFWIAPGLISCIFTWNNYFFIFYSVVHFFQSTPVSITFYLFEHYQLWMIDSKSQRVFFQKHQNCVLSTLKSATVIILRLVGLFQPWVPKWGVLANRLKWTKDKWTKTNWQKLISHQKKRTAACKCCNTCS